MHPSANNSPLPPPLGGEQPNPSSFVAVRHGEFELAKEDRCWPTADLSRRRIERPQPSAWLTAMDEAGLQWGGDLINELVFANITKLCAIFAAEAFSNTEWGD